ncbi:recombinase zinc beta ribbon domain-containing protein [Pelotomaculum sp. FP]|uniref:recombinase zinc beta ribbon domain-containing protein n=1 Tax=Pelotomaculum sp. FP TaxID=261474 RepID=UPI00106549E7|nr:recombinase zinc beta ribbon domain-containing protein [Pelotomaculum sp. FP]
MQFSFRNTNKEKKEKTCYAVALARVSTEDQFIKGNSVPEQDNRIDRWAQKNNVIIVDRESIHHSAYRGLDEDSRVLRLLEKAKSDQRISLFLVDEKSRFARRKVLRVTWANDLRKHGVEVIGVSEPEYDRKSIMGVWWEGMSETKDEARSVETAYWTMRGMLRNFQERDPETGYCYRNGGPPAYGYKNIRVIRGKDARGKDIIKLLWDVVEEQALIVRYVVLTCWHKRNMTLKTIINHLQSTEPKWDGRRDLILNARGKPWSLSSIREMCVKALEGYYNGIGYFNRTGKDLVGTGQKWKNQEEWLRIENAHPKIISDEEFAELVKVKGPLMEKRKKPGFRAPRAENSRYLFTGKNLIGENMFVCLRCGGPMKGSPSGGYLYYICSNRDNQASCDNNAHLAQDEIEKVVIEYIKGFFTPAMLEKIVEEAEKILKDDSSDQLEAERRLQKLIDEKQNSINNILEAIKHAQDSNVMPTLIKEMDKLQQEKSSLLRDLEEIKVDKPESIIIDKAMVLKKINSLDSVLRSKNIDNYEKKMAVKGFVKQLQYDPVQNMLHIYFWPSPVDQSSHLVIEALKKAEAGEKLSPAIRGGDTRI